MSRHILFLGLVFVVFAASLFTAAAAQTPVAVSGFNQDIVIEAGTPVDSGTFANAISATMDGGTSKTGNTWYQIAENTAALTTGLPMGTSFTSGSDPATTFSLHAATGNNVVLLNSVTTVATLTLNTPAMFSSLSLLGSSGNGPSTVSVTLQFSDATNLSLGNFVVSDWFNGTPSAYVANGRASINPAGFDNVNAGNPRLYQIDLNLPQGATTKTISAISLGFIGSGTNQAAFFALSGQAVPEPGTAGLLLAALSGAVLFVRRGSLK